MRKFKIYYAILSSGGITNCVTPGYRHVTGDTTSAGIAERKNTEIKYVNTLNNKNKFYLKLEESILKHGYINPILVQAGYCTKVYRKYLPIEHQKDITKALCCDRNGGSRLYIAKKHNFDIPCIISDFVGMFTLAEFDELHTEKDIFKKYNVPPKRIIINEHGIHVGQPVHMHLEK